MSNGFYLDIDGKYKDVDSNEELEVKELEHSVYGLLKYVIYNGEYICVNWTPSEELKELPDDWVGEI